MLVLCCVVLCCVVLCCVVCVCVCVCVYSSTVKASSVRKMSKTYLRVRINDLVLWILVGCFLPSSIISASENVIFHLQRRKLQPIATGEETIWGNALREKMIYIDVGYKSALLQKPTSDEKILMIRMLL